MLIGGGIRPAATARLSLNRKLKVAHALGCWGSEKNCFSGECSELSGHQV